MNQRPFFDDESYYLYGITSSAYTHDLGSITYAYDGIGNRLTIVEGGTTATYTCGRFSSLTKAVTEVDLYLSIPLGVIPSRCGTPLMLALDDALLGGEFGAIQYTLSQGHNATPQGA